MQDIITVRNEAGDERFVWVEYWSSEDPSLGGKYKTFGPSGEEVPVEYDAGKREFQLPGKNPLHDARNPYIEVSRAPDPSRQ